MPAMMYGLETTEEIHTQRVIVTYRQKIRHTGNLGNILHFKMFKIFRNLSLPHACLILMLISLVGPLLSRGKNSRQFSQIFSWHFSVA